MKEENDTVKNQDKFSRKFIENKCCFCTVINNFGVLTNRGEFYD
jgi:hypothetical protein